MPSSALTRWPRPPAAPAAGVFECELTGEAAAASDPAVPTGWLPCTSPASYPSLPDGTYRFSVREQGSSAETTVNFAKASGGAPPGPPYRLAAALLQRGVHRSSAVAGHAQKHGGTCVTCRRVKQACRNLALLACLPAPGSPVSYAPCGARVCAQPPPANSFAGPAAPSPALSTSPSPVLAPTPAALSPPLVSGAPEGGPWPSPSFPPPPFPLVSGAPEGAPPAGPAEAPGPAQLAPSPYPSLSLPPASAVIGRRLRALAGRLQDAVLGGPSRSRQSSSSSSSGAEAVTRAAGIDDLAAAHAAGALYGSTGGRRLLQDLLASDGGVADLTPFEYMDADQLLGGEGGRAWAGVQRRPQWQPRRPGAADEAAGAWPAALPCVCLAWSGRPASLAAPHSVCPACRYLGGGPAVLWRPLPVLGGVLPRADGCGRRAAAANGGPQ